MFASAEYFANNPKSQLLQNLKIRLLKGEPGTKPRITAAEKKHAEGKSKSSFKIAAKICYLKSSLGDVCYVE
jgi:hypothetical protein